MLKPDPNPPPIFSDGEAENKTLMLDWLLKELRGLEPSRQAHLLQNCFKANPEIGILVLVEAINRLNKDGGFAV